MRKKLILTISLLVLLIIGLVIVENAKPKPIDWYPHYKVSKKTPFGLYVWNNELEKVFPKKEIIRVKNDLYDFLDDIYDYDTDEFILDGTFFYVSKDYDIDEYTEMDLLAFAYEGNTVFLSVSSFSLSLLNELSISNYSGDWYADSVQIQLPGNNAAVYDLPVWHTNKFIGYDLDSTITPIGVKFSNKDEIGFNFVQIEYGEGLVYLHTNPEVFSNYFLLDPNNRKYTEFLSGYLNYGKHLIFYTEGIFSNQNIGDSSLRFILSQRSLRWAWFLLLLTAVLFMIFKAKRMQRIIPIKLPHVNTTVQFVQTIADLHYRERDYYGIMDKRILFFLEKIRNDYRIDTSEINKSFRDKLLQILDADKKDIAALYQAILKHKTTKSATEYDLIGLNRLLEKKNL